MMHPSSQKWRQAIPPNDSSPFNHYHVLSAQDYVYPGCWRSEAAALAEAVRIQRHEDIDAYAAGVDHDGHCIWCVTYYTTAPAKYDMQHTTLLEEVTVRHNVTYPCELTFRHVSTTVRDHVRQRGAYWPYLVLDEEHWNGQIASGRYTRLVPVS